jgi:hypothetical protein
MFVVLLVFIAAGEVHRVGDRGDQVGSACAGLL